MRILELQVNGTRRRVEVDGERSLLSVLRDELDLTGAKYGCGEGQCGACTVLVDGRAARSCLTQAASVEGNRSPLSKVWSGTAPSIRCRRPSWP